MRRFLKRLSLSLCAVLILALGIMAGAHLFLKTDTGAQEILRLINDLIPGKISGRDITLSLLDQSVAMHAAVLKGPDGQTIVQAERLRLSMDLPALARGDLIFKDIHLEHADGVLMIDVKGRFNIVKALVKETPEKSKLAVFIHKLTCRDGDVAVRGPDGKAWARVKDFDLAFDAAFTANTVMHIALPRAKLSLIAGGQTIDCGDSSLSGTIINESVQNILFTMQRHTSRMVVKGGVTNLADKAKVRCDLRFDLELADFRDGLGLPASTRGRISGTIGIGGVYDNPRVACDLAYGGGVIQGAHLGPMRLKGVLAERVFTCSELAYPFASGLVRASGTLDLGAVFPRGYYGGAMEPDKAVYALALTAQGLRLAESGMLPPNLHGTLGADMHIRGRGVTPRSLNIATSFQARVDGFQVNGLVQPTMLACEGQAQYGGGTLSLTPLTARMNGAEITARGQVVPATQAMAGTVELKTAQIARLLPPFTNPAHGGVRATAALSGTFKAPQVGLRLSGETCAWRDITVGALNLEGHLDPYGQLTITRGQISNQASRIEARGDIQLFRGFPRLDPDLAMRMRATLTGVVPRDFFPGMPVGGSFTGQVTAAGSRRTLTGEVALTGKSLTYDHTSLGDFEGAGTLGDGLFTISRARLTKGRSQLALAGGVQVLERQALRFLPDPGLNITIDQGHLWLEDFTADAQGEVLLSGGVHGSVQRPTGMVTCRGRALTVGKQPVEGAELITRFEGDTLRLDPIVIQLQPSQEIRGSGWVNRQGNYALGLSGQGIELENLELARVQAAGLKGKLSLRADGQGSLRHPQLTAHAKLEQIRFQDQVFPDGTLDLELRDDLITFEAMLNFAVKGWYALDNAAYQAIAVFERSDLAPFFGLWGKPNLAGTISGQITASGKGLEPDGIESVEADLSDLNVYQGRRQLIEADTIKGVYHERNLSIPATHVRLGRDGSMDVRAGGNIEKNLVFTAQGDVPVGVIATLYKGLEGARGNIDFNAQVTTGNAHTAINALIKLRDVTYPIDYNGQQLQAVKGDIRIDDDRVVIDAVTGLLDTGAFSLAGTATLRELSPSTLDLTLHAMKLPIAVPDTMDFTVDGDTTLKADRKHALLKSDLAITDATYYRDVEINLLSGVLERILLLRKPVPRQSSSEPLPWPFTPAMELDMNLKRRGTVKVENNIATLDLNPDLRVTGTMGNPIVNGRITVTDGVVTFQGNEFEVKRGAIDFMNPHRTEATVDIESQTTVRDWTISLAIEGALDNLEIALSSVPAEERSDILSLLLVGKTSQEITQNQTGVRVSPAGMMAELVAGTYGKEIKKATTLDILKVESGDFSTSQTGENLKVTLGKDLTPRLSIQYEVGNTSTGTAQRGIAAYKLLDHVLVNGYQGSEGIYGADIQFKYDFR